MEKEIDLKNLFSVIKRRIWILVTSVLLFSFAGAIYSTYFITPVYDSTARMVIRDDTKFFNTLTEVIREPVIMTKVAAELELNRSPQRLASQISVSPVGESQIVQLTVTDTDPVLAAKIANSTMKHYIEELPRLLNFKNIKILTAATENVQSYKENPINKIMMGMVIGLVIGIGLIFLSDSLDDTVRNESEIEKLAGLPVLGTVSKINRKTAPHNKNKRLKLSIRGESVVTYK
ncbi:Wzz/FepE/Etk N-terminal domain-containing protein [Bacillus sp. FJAT-42376]|uniref:YveK family protein n=1 Tax=Bacillus sp. FJAT-42376 TaxID=2014076 RepID=UPI0013DE55B0|nr:Wzz/FepE/Etk N-terminal domain-containing protein [Bacillus sp. FJAT-42376]